MSGGGKVCESCKSGKAMLYCRVDSVFLCMGCDNRIHNGGANEHERVWICDVCEQAPGSVTCKADAAVLCVNCDRDIHSVNPLALRHERYPVSPFYHSSSSIKTTNAFNLIFSNIDDDNNNNSNSDILVNSSQAAAAPENYNHKEEDEVEGAHAWMSLPNPPPKKCVEEEAVFDVAKSTGGAGAGGDYFFSDADPYFDLDYVPSMEINFHNNHKTSRIDGVVPEQKNSTVPPSLPPPSQLSSSSSLSTSAGHGHGHGQYYIDFSGGGSNSKPLTTTQSYHSSTTTPKSLAKTDAGVVPDGNSIDGGSAIATQLCGLDREARVLRYREKRKNRKFEKTIRYASRKAYAETRPRVKGRFVPMGTR